MTHSKPKGNHKIILMNESEPCQRRGAAASLCAPAPTVCLIPKYADVFLPRQANLDCFGGDGSHVAAPLVRGDVFGLGGMHPF